MALLKKTMKWFFSDESIAKYFLHSQNIENYCNSIVTSAPMNFMICVVYGLTLLKHKKICCTSSWIDIDPGGGIKNDINLLYFWKKYFTNIRLIVDVELLIIRLYLPFLSFHQKIGFKINTIDITFKNGRNLKLPEKIFLHISFYSTKNLAKSYVSLHQYHLFSCCQPLLLNCRRIMVKIHSEGGLIP